MDNRALTIDEFCDRFRICRATAYHLIRTGKLRARKLGLRTILLAPDMDAYAANLPDFHFRTDDRFGHKRFRAAERSGHKRASA